MGSTSSKFRKYLQNGDEFAAMQVYQSSGDLQRTLDPNLTYGESYENNTPLHYACKHAMKHLIRTFLYDLHGNPNKRNAHNETALHTVCHLEAPRSYSAQERRASCIVMLLQWRGVMLTSGDQEKIDVSAVDEKKNTALHYAAQSGLKKCAEYLIANGSSLFVENDDCMTPCDCAEQAGYSDIAAFLESKMVFADLSDVVNEDDVLIGFETSEMYSGLRALDLQEAKDQLLVETSDMLHVPLFTAEALLRNNEWSRETLLERWIVDPIACCDKAGVQPPSSALANRRSSERRLSILDKTSVQASTSKDRSTPIKIPARLETLGDSLENGQAVADVVLDGASRRSSALISDDSFNEEDGLKSPKYGTTALPDSECEICATYFTVEDGQVPALCEHNFCKSCWEGYLNVKIQDGDAHNIMCPAYGCSRLVPVELIEQLVSPDMVRRYLQFDIKNFVESNPHIKWCPFPRCGRAVKLPENSLMMSEPFVFPNASRPMPVSHAVDCGNGHYFCWECLGVAHAPCSCDRWSVWHRKIEEVKPEELRGDTGKQSEDAANCLWMLSNSKPCPNCKSPIQKNEGCNHLKCSKCKFDFCWLCLESWKKHGSATGGYFMCNRFEVIQKVDDRHGGLVSQAEVKSRQLQELNRFVHYYSRFKSHENSHRLEEPLLNFAQEKMVMLSKSFAENSPRASSGEGKAVVDTKFVEDAVGELLKSRRVLCGSYVYGYYLEDNGCNKTIFELMQNELESCVEKLAQMIARPYLKSPRHKIVQTANQVRRKRHEFLVAVAKGLIPPETPPTMRKFCKRRFPGLIGLDPVEDDQLNNAIAASLQELDPNNPWVKDPNGTHRNLSAMYDWPDCDSDDETANGLSNALAASFLGTCGRNGCKKAKARNPRTGNLHEFCSLQCSATANQKEQAKEETNETIGSSNYQMDLLIALEMSRLQMIEDRVRMRSGGNNLQPEEAESSHSHTQSYSSSNTGVASNDLSGNRTAIADANLAKPINVNALSTNSLSECLSSDFVYANALSPEALSPGFNISRSPRLSHSSQLSDEDNVRIALCPIPLPLPQPQPRQTPSVFVNKSLPNIYDNPTMTTFGKQPANQIRINIESPGRDPCCIDCLTVEPGNGCNVRARSSEFGLGSCSDYGSYPEHEFVAVDYFLKSLGNKEDYFKNTHFNGPEFTKTEKELINFCKSSSWSAIDSKSEKSIECTCTCGKDTNFGDRSTGVSARATSALLPPPSNSFEPREKSPSSLSTNATFFAGDPPGFGDNRLRGVQSGDSENQSTTPRCVSNPRCFDFTENQLFPGGKVKSRSVSPCVDKGRSKRQKVRNSSKNNRRHSTGATSDMFAFAEVDPGNGCGSQPLGKSNDKNKKNKKNKQWHLFL